MTIDGASFYCISGRWCPRRDSNPHTLRHMDLNHARLPIPPRGHCCGNLEKPTARRDFGTAMLTVPSYGCASPAELAPLATVFSGPLLLTICYFVCRYDCSAATDRIIRAGRRFGNGVFVFLRNKPVFRLSSPVFTTQVVRRHAARSAAASPAQPGRRRTSAGCPVPAPAPGSSRWRPSPSGRWGRCSAIRRKRRPGP